MIKTLARMEHKIGERLYHLLCDSDSPLVEVKEALCKFMGNVSVIEEAALKAAEKAKAEEESSKAEDTEVEVIPKAE